MSDTDSLKACLTSIHLGQEISFKTQESHDHLEETWLLINEIFE